MHKEKQRGFRKAWTRCGQAGPQRMGANYSGPPSTTPPGNGQYQHQNPAGAPFKNRMYGDTVGGEHGGAAHAPQYTPQPFGGFNTGQPLGYMQMGGPQDIRQDKCHTHSIRWARHARARFMGCRVSSSTGRHRGQRHSRWHRTPYLYRQCWISASKWASFSTQNSSSRISSSSRTSSSSNNTAYKRTKQCDADARTVFEWRQEVEAKGDERILDVSRVKMTPISVSTASKAQNSQYLFMGQLEELNVTTSGGTAEQIKQLKQLVEKWCCESEPIIASLRNTFDSGGSGAGARGGQLHLPHAREQQRDIDPEGEVARYDYSKLMAGTGTEFHSELLNFKESIARLPKGVRADPAYWINHGLLASFD